MLTTNEKNFIALLSPRANDFVRANSDGFGAVSVFSESQRRWIPCAGITDGIRRAFFPHYVYRGLKKGSKKKSRRGYVDAKIPPPDLLFRPPPSSAGRARAPCSSRCAVRPRRSARLRRRHRPSCSRRLRPRETSTRHRARPVPIRRSGARRAFRILRGASRR